MTSPRLLPAASGDPDPWHQALYAFLVEKGNRSGSRRTVEGYGRMLWPFFADLGKTPDRVTPSRRPGLGARDRDVRPDTLRRHDRREDRLPLLFLPVPHPDGTRRPAIRVTPSSARGRALLPARGLTADDVRRLLAVVPDTVRGRRDRALLLTFILTGRRRSEVLNLTAGDIIVGDDLVMYQYRGKGGKTGRRELPRPAYDAIVATLADSDRELTTMAPDQSLWRISSGTFYGRFRRYLQTAGLAPTGLHILRHSAAKLRRDAGETVEQVSAFLDHSSLAVTTTYLRRLEGVEDRTWREVAVAIGV